MAALSRRGLLSGLLGIVAAPAIVRASSLMPIKSIPLYDPVCEWISPNTLRMTVPILVHCGQSLWTYSEAQADDFDTSYVVINPAATHDQVKLYFQRNQTLFKNLKEIT